MGTLENVSGILRQCGFDDLKIDEVRSHLHIVAPVEKKGGAA